MRQLLCLALCALLGACAFTPQRANIVPTVNATPSSIGQGVVVAVRVVDERSSQSLGRRGTAYGPAAEITAQQDLTAVVTQQVRDALRLKGFEVADYTTSAPVRLSIEIRLLEYSTSQGFWTGGVQIQSTLKALATNGDETYEKVYRSDTEERVAVVPTAETNERWINRALSDTLNQLVNDEELARFLARPQSP